MPTGYTSKLYDGKPQTFEEFALECARAFGALVTLRDEPEAVIPDEFKPSDYNDRRLVECRAELIRLESLSQEQILSEYEAECQRKRAAYEQVERQSAAVRERYEAMLREVKAWEPPTAEHLGLKDFMLDQLTRSIDFDGGQPNVDWSVVGGPAKEWHAQRVKKAHEDVGYHAAEAEKERARAESRTRWVRALRQSLQSKVPA